ncbi:MAG: electron transport complex subunit RsxG [Gallionellaceae bacterium]|nr:MAG: electron transport complex subunit RsxG [Gallionellaceae bacterium]
MKRLARASLQSAANLIFFAVIGTAVLASTFFLTHDEIVKSEKAEKLKLITQIVPPTLFDNDIIQDTLDIPATDLLGTEDITTAYRARLKGEPSAVVLESVAPDGYSGKIWLILAVRANGELAGVRAVAHKETPGLGDYIELPKSAWIKGFDGKSREAYKDADWKVKKDGGQFDYMAGATITPRAVVKAVNKALQYFAANRDTLFAANTSSPDKGRSGGVKEKQK